MLVFFAKCYSQRLIFGSDLLLHGSTLLYCPPQSVLPSHPSGSELMPWLSSPGQRSRSQWPAAQSKGHNDQKLPDIRISRGVIRWICQLTKWNLGVSTSPIETWRNNCQHCQHCQRCTYPSMILSPKSFWIAIASSAQLTACCDAATWFTGSHPKRFTVWENTNPKNIQKISKSPSRLCSRLSTTSEGSSLR